jgi:hypothetical protein
MCVCIFIADNYMSKASDREEIKDETYQVQDEEQEELDDEEDEEKVKQKKNTFSNKDRSKK